MVRLQVKELAKKRGMSQKALAEKAEVSTQLLNRYWNNHVQRVDLKELGKIATALDVEPGALISAHQAEKTKDAA